MKMFTAPANRRPALGQPCPAGFFVYQDDIVLRAQPNFRTCCTSSKTFKPAAMAAFSFCHGDSQNAPAISIPNSGPPSCGPLTYLEIDKCPKVLTRQPSSAYRKLCDAPAYQSRRFTDRWHPASFRNPWRLPMAALADGDRRRLPNGSKRS